MLSYLVGSHFRPPAKQVLAASRPGVRLRLQAEPENPYDPAAIKVFGQVRDMVPQAKWDELREELVACGEDLDSLDEIFLGYIARSGGKPSKGLPGNAEVAAAGEAAGGLSNLSCLLSFDEAGFPQVNTAESGT